MYILSRRRQKRKAQRIEYGVSAQENRRGLSVLSQTVPGGNRFYQDQFDIAAGGSSICPAGTVISAELSPTGIGTASGSIAGVGLGDAETTTSSFDIGSDIGRTVSAAGDICV